MNTFSELSVPTELCAALEKRGITVPTAVQRTVIPALTAGESILFQSETGTGKTLCYLLPAFMKCMSDAGKDSPKILVIAPTHELASQIKTEAVTLAQDSGLPITAALCIGGAPLKRQIEMLKQKPTLLAGGPARILELIRLKKLSVRGIQTVVMDETDRMLSPEMRDILAELLSVMPSDAQFIACSATLSKYHASLLERMIPAQRARADAEPKPEGKAPSHRLRLISLPPEEVLRRNIAHWAFYSEGRDKIETLRRFLVAEKPAKALVFTAIAGQVENIAAQLRYKKVPCSALYAKLDKLERKKNMDDFRAGRTTVLVTSDLAARGLDIPNVTHIIQLDVNENEDFFIHRAGRTARAGKSGINVIFGDERELRNLARIEKKLGIVVYPKVLYGGKVSEPEQFDDDGEDPAETER
ncbi:MAG TPA: DEAD/DEAH box helicase [Treponemataceae bacterium]|nr:DEAD/DEAH box helicase [Treponemataceae bacterium]HPS43904.1 DEAD/DEAH box helicase [Treponemataceae bacterium]